MTCGRKEDGTTKAKEYLQQLWRLDTLINQKIRELGDLRIKLRSVGGIDYSDERVKTGFSKDDPLLEMIIRIFDLEKEIKTEINRYVDDKHRIINQIQTLTNTVYIDILYKRYVEFKRLEVISVEMNYTYDYIKHLHGYALQDFENKILNSTPNNT